MEYIIRRTSDHLEHHGILGQKWGVRRFQNPDGTWTAEGKKRYGSSDVDSNTNTSAVRKNGEVRSTKQLKKDFPKLDAEAKYDKATNTVEEDPESAESWNKMDELVRDKCGDWYLGEWKTDRLKEIHQQRKEAEKKLNDKDPNVILNKAYKKIYDEAQQEKLNDPQIKKWLNSPLVSKRDKLWIEAKIDDYARSIAESDKNVQMLQKKANRTWKDHWAKEQAITEKYDQLMLGEILNTLGYENTQEARDFIKNVVIWD